VRIAPLSEAHLPEATGLLQKALPHDRIDVVAREKLLGDNGSRAGAVSGAFEGAQLVGVFASAGRWIKLIAVAAEYRRRGIGTQLLRQMAPAKWRAGDHPGNYLTPGVDERYTEALAFFSHHRFREVARVENLRGRTDLASTDVAGVKIRRAEPSERLSEWITEHFAAVWAHEVAHAQSGPLCAVHLAFIDGALVGFAAADGNNQGLGWFGPAGTLPQARGRGIGEALLLRCLQDVRGLPEGGVIAWIGPKKFYEKAMEAKTDRVFVQLERPE
jgi:ribosomal protein S18 acetylase RimI-like enzyme